MTDPLGPLRTLISAACTPPAGDTAIGVYIERLIAAIDACFARLVDLDEVPFAELVALADALRDRSHGLPDEIRRAHFDWLRVQRRWYKLVMDPDGTPRAPDLPAGTPSPALVLVPHLYEQISELRYVRHLRQHPAACDCAALRVCGRAREPRSPELRHLGPGTDGYYVGDTYRCGACGARWFRGIGDDDHGTLFWAPDD